LNAIGAMVQRILATHLKWRSSVKVGDLIRYRYDYMPDDDADKHTIGIITKDLGNLKYHDGLEDFVEVHWFDDQEKTKERVSVILDKLEEWIWVCSDAR
jgi:hypothetical protein